MKKIVAIMLVLVALSTSVFAGDSYLSLNLVSEFDFAFQTVDVSGFEYEKDSSNGYLGIGAEWTNYFGDSSIAGLLLGFVYNGPIYSKAGDVTAPITTLDYELIPRVGLALKFDFTDSFSLESGLSLAFAIGKADRATTEYFNDGWIESNTYTNTFTLDVYGRLGIIWKFSQSWALHTGMDFAYMLLDSAYMGGSYTEHFHDGRVYSGSSTEHSVPSILADFSINPYLGIAFCY